MQNKSLRFFPSLTISYQTNLLMHVYSKLVCHVFSKCKQIKFLFRSNSPQIILQLRE